MSGKIVRQPSGVSRTTATAKIANGRTASAKSGTARPPNANES
jgi:hypothetical protein